MGERRRIEREGKGKEIGLKLSTNLAKAGGMVYYTLTGILSLSNHADPPKAMRPAVILIRSDHSRKVTLHERTEQQLDKYNATIQQAAGAVCKMTTLYWI